MKQPVYGGDSTGMGSIRTDSSSSEMRELGGEPRTRSGARPSMTADSLGTEWTDEKHRSYLNSMEDSFVRQLHNQEYFSAHLLNWLWKKRKLQNQRPELLASSTSKSVGQFKVLKEVSWKKFNFHGADFQADASGNAQELLIDRCVSHFQSTSSSRGRRVSSLKLLENSSSVVDESPMTESNEEMLHSSMTHFTQIPGHLAHMHIQKCVGYNTEVSDQNFSDEDGEDKNFDMGIPTKKLNDRNNEASAVDQVDPFARSLNSDESHAPVIAEDGHTYTKSENQISSFV